MPDVADGKVSPVLFIGIASLELAEFMAGILNSHIANWTWPRPKLYIFRRMLKFHIRLRGRDYVFIFKLCRLINDKSGSLPISIIPRALILSSGILRSGMPKGRREYFGRQFFSNSLKLLVAMIETTPQGFYNFSYLFHIFIINKFSNFKRTILIIPIPKTPSQFGSAVVFLDSA